MAPPRVWRVPKADASTVRVRAPAKVNLHLGVGPQRPDGYHDLVTVFHAVDLTDEIIARPADRLEICVAGEGSADLPTDEGNLAWRAAALLAEHAGVAPRVRLEITKSIPVAGGMAGGSADAAAALVACAALWGTGTPRTVLAELAARLGSDVAFPLFGGTALGTGRGEVLTPVMTRGSFHWVFALADHGISAGDAYRELDRQRAAGSAPRPAAAPDRVIEALRAGRSAPTRPRPGQRSGGRRARAGACPEARPSPPAATSARSRASSPGPVRPARFSPQVWMTRSAWPRHWRRRASAERPGSRPARRPGRPSSADPVGSSPARRTVRSNDKYRDS